MMNPEPILSPEVAQLGRAIRFAFACFIIALSYFTIRATLAVPAFEGIFRDMLNGKSLPPLTVFVIHAHYELIACSLAVPIVTIGTLFNRRLVVSFYLLGGLCLLTLAQFLLMYQGLSAPLYEIIRQMQGG